MKKHIKYLSILLSGAMITAFTACNDFLDMTPESQVTPAAYFTDESDLEAYSLNLYTGTFNAIGTGSYGIGTFSNDNGTDNQASMDYSARWVPGEWLVGSGSWDFSMIRNCNYFFDQVLPKYEAGKIAGSQSNIDHYIGEMYVIRALAFFAKLQDIGDCPIFENALPDEKAALMEASKRQPRNQVARFILSDLDKALGLLNMTNKNRITRDVALLIRSRVALFEGTWLKYHKGTAFVPGGNGWPGNKADIEGFNIDSEIDYFLTEAMTSAKELADKHVSDLTVNTDTPEGMSPSLEALNPYYMMFCDVDMESYDEVLMWRRFNKSLGITHNIQMQLGRNGGGTGWTLGLVNSFLMQNGLPIYAPGSGYDPEWEKDNVKATLQDRDSRIRIFTKQDNDVDFYYADGTPQYTFAHWILDGQAETKMVTGFPLKKGKHYNASYGADGTHQMGVTGSLIYRSAEALLNYIEASYEKNGTIDATAASYWKALRTRAKVDTDYQKTINATVMSEEAKWDWGAYSHNQLVDATLYNIRRERRNEYIGESMRLFDLRRWRALDQLATTPYIIRGMRFWGSTYEIDGIMSETGEEDVEVIVDIDGGTGNMSAGVAKGGIDDYIRPYQITKINNSVFDGYSFTPAHYLSPLGQATFRKTATDESNLDTSVVYQNPGWSKVAGTAPSPVQ